ncbi:YceI family protein [Aquibacillus sp. 3ASR75-11]|uniref:YceI family protein n=1 Tax=Terrihalobacillus insolitus TaxID=2950438 RepID=A0A9X4AQ00_9BACI|nr:YceI family protein [Terrihalobacillus insolitus]MDC3415258.1 YceI family protein [Terrihalobacillus insolitus]MDC3426098.1 YceI family protein [Terrihalobacillus insolitus]
MTKTAFKVDPGHTSIDFSVKHMMVSKVKGTFHEFDANITADPEDLTSAEIEVNVDIKSIDTRNTQRDEHLRSADFFDVENNPKLTFKSTKVTKKSDDEYEVTGDLSIANTTRSETFKVEFEGSAKDPWGNEVYGFSAEGKIKRSDYGITYNAALETGGVLIGDEIKINVELEAVKEG